MDNSCKLVDVFCFFMNILCGAVSQKSQKFSSLWGIVEILTASGQVP